MVNEKLYRYSKERTLVTILSWICALLTLSSVYVIGKKKPYGHIIGLIGSIGWAIEMWTVNPVQVGLNVIFICLYLKNYISWKKGE